jgi:hypothetical protein
VKIKSVFLGALLCFSLGAPPAHAGACSELLTRAGHYLRDVRDSKGLRLLIKPSDNAIDTTGDSGGRTPYHGFLSRNKKNKLRPTPFKGLQTWLVDKPVDALVHKFSGPHRQGTLLVKLPVLVAWALLAQVYVIDPVTDMAYDHRITEQVEVNKTTFDRLIQTDYRFETIRTALKSGEIAPEEAERQAYMVSRAYASYYRYRDGRHAEFSLDDDVKLLDHYLFGHLRPVMEGSVEVPDGFETTTAYSTHLNDAQKLHLFNLTHGLYFEYQIIEQYLSGQTPDPQLAPLITDLDHDDFTARLKQLRQTGGISTGQFHHALQEHAFWAYRLRCYAAIGLRQLNPATGQPARLSDYDAEILADLGLADPAAAE